MRNFEQLLDPRELTAHYVQAPALVNFPFTETFYTNVRNVDSDELELVYFNNGKAPAPLNLRGAEARLMSSSGGNKIKMHLFHAFNQLPLPADCLRALREPDSEAMQAKGEFVVQMVLDEFANKHRILKEAVIAHTLCYHNVYFGNDGNLLLGSVDGTTGVVTAATGAVAAADWGIPDSHRGTLRATAGDAGSAVVSALWSTDSTDIVAQLDKIKRRAARAQLPIPTEIWCNAVNRNYILQNTDYAAWAIQNPQANTAFLQGADIIQGLWGWNWRFFNDTYELNVTTYDLIPSDLALIFPKVGPWVRSLAGSELVPMDLNVKSSGMEALNSLAKTYGPFAYACVEHNPVRIDAYMGDNFGVNFAEPSALWAPTVFTAAT